MNLVNQTKLIEAALRGKVVSFPTDTVPALAVIPSEAALIYALKKRPDHKPLILMGADWSDLAPYVTGNEQERELWQKMAEKYWPGALTLVLPSSELTSPALNPLETGTIGIRVPAHPIAREILAQTGPLATTSANLSGHPPLINLGEIALTFSEVFTLSITSEEVTNLATGKPSTVVKWVDNSWKTLRFGSVIIEETHE